MINTNNPIVAVFNENGNLGNFRLIITREIVEDGTIIEEGGSAGSIVVDDIYEAISEGRSLAKKMGATEFHFLDQTKSPPTRKTFSTTLDEADKLERDIIGLRKSIKGDYRDLASLPLSSDQQAGIRTNIALLTQLLQELEQKLDGPRQPQDLS